jgi:hypothetical protein
MGTYLTPSSHLPRLLFLCPLCFLLCILGQIFFKLLPLLIICFLPPLPLYFPCFVCPLSAAVLPSRHLFTSPLLQIGYGNGLKMGTLSFYFIHKLPYRDWLSRSFAIALAKFDTPLFLEILIMKSDLTFRHRNQVCPKCMSCHANV